MRAFVAAKHASALHDHHSSNVRTQGPRPNAQRTCRASPSWSGLTTRLRLSSSRANRRCSSTSTGGARKPPTPLCSTSACDGAEQEEEEEEEEEEEDAEAEVEDAKAEEEGEQEEKPLDEEAYDSAPPPAAAGVATPPLRYTARRSSRVKNSV